MMVIPHPTRSWWFSCPSRLADTYYRNRHVNGASMVETVHNSQPTIQSDGEDIPLISSYAFKDENSYSVFVLSRKLDGNHDGVDFGSGYTPVTLHLPFSKVAKITRYRLEKPDGTPVDPRTNNILDLQVTIGALEIDSSIFSQDFVIDETTGGEIEGVPPGSINLFVFELNSEQPPSLEAAISVLKLCAGLPVNLAGLEISDINGDNKFGIEEVMHILHVQSGLQ